LSLSGAAGFLVFVYDTTECNVVINKQKKYPEVGYEVSVPGCETAARFSRLPDLITHFHCTVSFCDIVDTAVLISWALKLLYLMIARTKL
jgi:hypothetical protein